MIKPEKKPRFKMYSSGPTAPPYGGIKSYSPPLGRSHRSSEGRKDLKLLEDLIREVLEIPSTHLVGLHGGGATGGLEAVFHSFLGPNPVIVAHWEAFGSGWLTDLRELRKVDKSFVVSDLGVNRYGLFPDLRCYDGSNDLVITANGTTSGVKVPNWDFIPDHREGLVIVDATSGAGCMHIDWSKCDIVVFPAQKAFGADAQTCAIVLSPRAVLCASQFPLKSKKWPMIKLHRLIDDKGVSKGIFEQTKPINTPAWEAVGSWIRALLWMKDKGGLSWMVQKTDENYQVIEDWVEKHDWIRFLCNDPLVRSHSSVTLELDPTRSGLNKDQLKSRPGLIVDAMGERDVAFDFKNYGKAPPGFRFWCGPTIQTESLQLTLEWLAWFYSE